MKHLKLFFALFAMLALGVGNAWGETTTYVMYPDGGSTFNAEWNKTSRTAKQTYASKVVVQMMGVNSGVYGEITSKNSVTNINAISVKCTANNAQKLTLYYSTNNSQWTELSTTSISKNTSSYSDYDIDIAGIPATAYIKFRAEKNSIYLYSITISTSEVADPVDPTVSFNDASYTVGQTLDLSSLWTSNSTGEVTYTVVNAGTTGASISSSLFTATAAGTCEVKASQAATSAYNAIEKTATITVTAPTPATITLSEAGVETSVSGKNVGDSYTLPKASSQTCGDKIFVGWSTVEISTPGDKPTTNFHEPGAPITLTATQTFYAVYATEGGGGGNVFDGTNGGNFKIYAVVNGTNYYATGTGTKIASTTNEADATEYTFTKINDGVFSIKTGSTYITYASSSNLGTNNTTAYNWNISAGTNGTWRIASVATNTRGIIYRASTYQQFGGYALSNATASSTEYFDVEIGGGSAASYSNYTTSCGSAPTPAVLVSIAKTAGKTEFTEGDTFEKATITATYDDATTKDVTSLATFTGYDMNTTGTQTVDVTYEGKSTSYTITVNPKPKYTITWNNAGTTTTTEVVQGEALVTLPEPADCPSGKKFMGWTAATEVNNDGSGIVYVKETDIPTSDITYYAVFAVEKVGEGEVGSADVTLADGNFADSKITWDADYATIVQEKVSGSTAVNSSYVASPRWYVGHEVTITPKTTINITAITINQGTGDYAKFDQATATNASIAIDGQTVTITPLDGTKAVVLSFAKQVRPTSINIAKGPATTYSDYSLNCDISVEPTWTISKNEIAFADKYVGFEYTETFTINASNLAEDIALAIDGSTFTVSPTSIAKDASFPQTVTVTYAPIAVGTHNATLNITSSSTLSKTIALTGSATEATIYTLTALADINPTDKVIIVGTSGGNTYAMSNDKGTSDAPDAIAVTVIDNKIATDKTNILWNIAKDGDNLTIYPANQIAKWLYCLADNNDGVRVGTGEAKLFTIDKGYLYTTQTTAARHIGIYNNSDWRCYKPSADAIHTNIKEQSFAFYVLPDTDPSISVNTTSKDFGAVINGKSASQEFEITARNIATPAFSTSVTGANATYFTATINANKVIVTYAPTAVGEHVAALTITETTTSKSVEVALTGECVETVNVATAMALPVDEIAYLSQFEVVYPLKDKSYIYIKDNSGYGLIYDGTLDEQFKAGDRVEGFVGTSSPYKSLPELKAVNKYEDLTITSSVAAEPIEFVTAPTVTDVNKYVVFKNVQFDAAVTFATDAATNTTFTIGSETVTLRNNYKYAASLDANKAYDVYGFVATFQQNEGDPIQVQVYFLTAVEAGGVIETYTVTYDANGATGAAPVDETKYQAGQTFYIENQGELVKEGYEFVGWKYNGTIYEAGKQFTMPAENVTFVAQWEEIVVTPRQDFSAGLWVLVTDASELAANDYIIVAAKDYNVAMVSYDYDVRKNNCGQTDITKFGNNNCFLTWKEEIGVFQLATSGSNYTIQDVNTEEYLYAAGGESSNYLKAADEIPADAEAAKPYIWSITIADGVTTVQATSNGRNLLKYNATNNSGQLFSCYASGQKDIAIYKYVTDFYTRDVTNKYGTICLPYGSTNYAGATFYRVAGKEEGSKVYLESVEALEAGVPYIFEKTANQIKVVYTGEAVDAPQNGDANGLVGTFVETTVPDGMYILYQGAFCTNEPAGTLNKIKENRAYLNMANVDGGVPQQMPGRRYIGMSVQGENEATGFENITAPEGKTVKAIVNGQLIIIRGGEKFNAQGQKL